MIPTTFQGRSYAQVVRRDNPAYWWRSARNGSARSVGRPGRTTPLEEAYGSWLTDAHDLPGDYTSGVTFEAWIKPSAAFTEDTVYAVFARGNTGLFFVNGQLRYTPTDYATDYVAVDDVWRVGRWLHVVAIARSGQHELWVNGRRARSEVVGDGETDTTADPTASLATMVGASLAVEADAFPGVVAEPALYGYALALSQVREHYRVGAGEVPRQSSVDTFAITAEPEVPSTVVTPTAFGVASGLTQPIRQFHVGASGAALRPGASSYENIIVRDKPSYWWRPGRHVGSPGISSVGQGVSSSVPLLSGATVDSNRPLERDGIPGAANGVSTSIAGTSNLLNAQGWSTGSFSLNASAANGYTIEIWVRPRVAGLDLARFYNIFAVFNNPSLNTGAGPAIWFSGRAFLFSPNAYGTVFEWLLPGGNSSAIWFSDQSWYHIVGIARNGNSAMYVNGNQSYRANYGNPTATNVITPSSGSAYVGMGGQRDGTIWKNYSFPGEIAEPAIYAYPLSPSQIQQHYEAGVNRVTRSVKFFTVRDRVLQDSTENTAKTSTFAISAGMPVPAFVGPVSDTTFPSSLGVTAAFPKRRVVDQRTAAATVTPRSLAYEQVIQRDKPALWWRLGQANATNGVVSVGRAGNGRILTSASATSVLPHPGIPGSVGGIATRAAIGEDGSGTQGWASGFIAEPNLNASSGYTLECWVRLDNRIISNTVCNYFGRRDSALATFFGFYSYNNQLLFILQNGNGEFETSIAQRYGEWNHLVGIARNGSSEFWVNGLRVTSVQNGAPNSMNVPDVLTSSFEWHVARGYSSFWRSPSSPVAEPAVYDYALSPSQILEHYRAGSAATDANQRFVSSFGSLIVGDTETIAPLAIPATSNMPATALVGPISQTLSRPPLDAAADIATPAFVGPISDTAIRNALHAGLSIRAARISTALANTSLAGLATINTTVPAVGPTPASIGNAVDMVDPVVRIAPRPVPFSTDCGMPPLAFVGAIDDTAIPVPISLQPTVIPPAGIDTSLDRAALPIASTVTTPLLPEGPTPVVHAATVGVNTPYVVTVTTGATVGAAAVWADGFAGVVDDTALPAPLAPEVHGPAARTSLVFPLPASGAHVGTNAPRLAEGPTPGTLVPTIGFAAWSISVTSTPARVGMAARLADESAVIGAGSAMLSATVGFPNRRYGTGVTAGTFVPTVGFGNFEVRFGIDVESLALSPVFAGIDNMVSLDMLPLGGELDFADVTKWEGFLLDGMGGESGFPPPALTTLPSASNKNIVLLRLDFDGKNYIQPRDIEAVLVDAYNVELRANIDGEDSLIFSYPAESADVALLKHDSIVEFLSRRYRVAVIKDGRTGDGAKFFDVECNSLAMDLGTVLPNSLGDAGVSILPVTEESSQSASATGGKDPDHPAEDSILYAVSMEAGAKAILRWSSAPGWTIGTVEVDPERPTQTYSMAGRGESVLASFRNWAEITGTRLFVDTLGLKINFLQPSSTPVGYRIEYAKNLVEIRREMQPPQTTRLWAYGRNGLDLKPVNNNQYYIENYSWYMSTYGITEDEARANFLKDGLWETDDQIDAQNLYTAAVKKLAELSQPTISYEVTVASFPELGLPFVDLKLHDVVVVRDSELGIDIQTQVVGMTRYLAEPWRDEIELSYLKPGLGSSEGDTSSADVNRFGGGVIGGSTVGVKTVTDASVSELLELSVTAFASSPVTIGYSLVGEASKACRLDLEFRYGNSVVYKPIREQLNEGWNTISGTFYIPSIGQGTDNLFVNARLHDEDNVTFTLEEAAGNFFVYGQKIAGGVSTGAPLFNYGDNVSPIRPGFGLPYILDSRNLSVQTPLPFGDAEDVASLVLQEVVDDDRVFVAQIRNARVGCVVTFPSVTLTTL